MEKERSRQRFYTPDSGLVLQADRGELEHSRDDEAAGQVQSIYGRVDPREFGSRVAAEKPTPSSFNAVEGIPGLDSIESPIVSNFTELPPIPNYIQKNLETFGITEPKRKMGRETLGLLDGNEPVEGEWQEGLLYIPSKKETIHKYREMLTWLSKNFLSDEPQDVLQSTLDEILVILKDNSKKDTFKKAEIEGTVLGTREMTLDMFAELVQFSKQLVDYEAITGREGVEQTGSEELAIVFDNDREIENLSDNFEEDDRLLGSDILVIDLDWIRKQLAISTDDPTIDRDIEQLSRQVYDLVCSIQDPGILEQRLFDLLSSDRLMLIEALIRNRDQIIASRNENEFISVSGESDLDLPIIDLENMAFPHGSHTITSKRCILPEKSWKKVHGHYEEIHVPAPAPLPLQPNERLYPVSELPKWTHSAFPHAMVHFNRMQSRVVPVAFGSDDNVLLCAPTGAGKTNIALLTMLRLIGKYLYEVSESSSIQFSVDRFKIVYIAPMKALVQEMVSTFSARLAPYNINVSEFTGDAQLSVQQLESTQLIVTTPEKWDIVTRKSITNASGSTYTSDIDYSNRNSWVSLVQLVIIDEIHLLHDDRGPVLEAIVARLKLTQGSKIRIVGLSATLPNYADVGSFLNVNPDRGLFYFDSSFRPCPLQQTFFGFTDKKPWKRAQAMNEVVYEQTLQRAGKSQLLIFVHSRKDTVKTARMIRDIAMDRGTIGVFLQAIQTQIIGSESDAPTTVSSLLQANATKSNNADLKELLPYGFAVHHAGLTREDRYIVESLFSQGHIQCLVSTATLAWGVNLPAHTVIIKGTQVYYPEKGAWGELSPQDVLQMFGRAGRPQFDTFGEAILLTSHSELQYYLSLLNQQLPIESQFVLKLIDHLNSQIVLGTVRNRNQAFKWIQQTYLYIRMLKAPDLYHITDYDQFDIFSLVKKKCIACIHTAAIELEKVCMITYDKRTGYMEPTELGRIASHYYLQYKTVGLYNEHLRSHWTDIDIFQLFSVSGEFSLIPLRQEERLELARLSELVPIPVKEYGDTKEVDFGMNHQSSAKINILLQAYVSRLKLEGFALMADMIYVSQNAGRLFRALFELAIHKGFSRMAKRLLDLCKMIERRLWNSAHPLRQLFGCAITMDGQMDAKPIGSNPNESDILSTEVLRRLERKDIPSLECWLNLSPVDLGEMIRFPKLGNMIHRLLHHLPRVELDVQARPLMRSMLQIPIKITPTFTWDQGIHQISSRKSVDPVLQERFWIFIEDMDEEHLLYHESFRLTSLQVNDGSILLSLSVPILDPLPPAYYISVVSDRWLHSSTSVAISFRSLVLPSRVAPCMPILDSVPIILPHTIYDAIWDNWMKLLDHPGFVQNFPWMEWISRLWNWSNNIGAGSKNILNLVQTRAFRSIYHYPHEHVFVSSGSKSGKTFLAELAMARFLQQKPREDGIASVIVYLHPLESHLKVKEKHWKEALEGFYLAGDSALKIGVLNGNVSTDIQLLSDCNLILASPVFLEQLTRRAKSKCLRIGLLIMDDLHWLGTISTLERVVSRMRFLNAQWTQQLEEKRDLVRFIGLSMPCAQAVELGRWLGASFGEKDAPESIFHFSPNFRHHGLYGFQLNILPISDPLLSCYHVLCEESVFIPKSTSNSRKQLQIRKSGIIFVDNRQQVFKMATDLVSHCLKNGVYGLALESTGEILFDEKDRKEQLLKVFKELGIGIVYEGQNEQEMLNVENSFINGGLGLLVCMKQCSWSLKDDLTADIVILLGIRNSELIDSDTEKENGSIPWLDQSEMVTPWVINCIGKSCKRSIVFLERSSKKEYYRKILQDPIPLESALLEQEPSIAALNIPYSKVYTSIQDTFLAEIAAKNIQNKQDAVDWITWTWMYRRLTENPNYYRFAGSTHMHISEGLSEVVESTISALEQAGMIHTDDGQESIELSALGMISAYYSINYETVWTIASKLKATTKVKGVLELLTLAREFSHVPIRRNSEYQDLKYMERVHERMPWKSSSGAPSNMKAHILLQCHMSRLLQDSIDSNQLLPLEWTIDAQLHILPQTIPILFAIIDISSSNGWLTPALAGMDLCQMITQAMWDRDSSWKQLPNIGPLDGEQWVSKIPESLDTIYDLVLLSSLSNEMQDYIPNWIRSLKDSDLEPYLTDSSIKSIIDFLFSYPNIDVAFDLNQDNSPVYHAGDNIIVQVTLTRPMTGNCKPNPVVNKDSQQSRWYIEPVKPKYFTKEKEEGWWLVIEQLDSGSHKSLVSIKRIAYNSWALDSSIEESKRLRLSTTLNWNLSDTANGSLSFKLYLMSDTWMGCDQEYAFSVQMLPKVEQSD
jgi:pre-mRNA-splicing helicase BRR2